MITRDEFVQQAKAQGINDNDINKYLTHYASSQPQTSLIPNATGADTGYIPTPSPAGVTNVSAHGVPITQQFMNYNPKIEKYSGGYNYGVDFGYGQGAPVTLPQGQWQVKEASANGNFNRGYGNSILVQNMQTGEKLRVSHLSKLANLVAGQRLNGGQTVALTGATGNVTGPHLDVEYYDRAGKLANVLASQYRGYF